MFDIGWTELLVIGVVALIVVGPKDLPVMFHRLGQFTAKARGMAREFQRAMDDAAKEAGVKDVTRDLRNIASPKKLGLDKLREATRDLASVDPKRGPATQKLSEERAEKAAMVRDATAKAATERKAAEAAKAAGGAETAKAAGAATAKAGGAATAKAGGAAAAKAGGAATAKAGGATKAGTAKAKAGGATAKAGKAKAPRGAADTNAGAKTDG